MLSCETADGLFLLTYAGLGETSIGKVEPSDWINKALRGVWLGVEPAMQSIAALMQAELPDHLKKYPARYSREHVFLCPAFINGTAKSYHMGIALSSGSDVSSYIHRAEFDQPGRPAT